MNKLLLALGLVLFSCTSALAVDLTNQDSQAHKVKVTTGSGPSSEISIEAGATQKVCDSGCQIDVEGIGSINAAPADTFTIKDGAITLNGVTQV